MTCQQQGPGHLTGRTTRCRAGRRRPWTRRTPTPCSSSSSSCSGSASFSFVLPPWPSAIGTDHAPRVHTSRASVVQYTCVMYHCSSFSSMLWLCCSRALLPLCTLLHLQSPTEMSRSYCWRVFQLAVTVSSVCSVGHCYCCCTSWIWLGFTVLHALRDHHL